MTAAAAPEPLTGARLWLTALALALANFVVVLDITIANVSIPAIAGSLAVAPSQGTWVVTSYSVAEAISVPLAGWLALRFGVVRWFSISLFGFGLFSLLCGLSQNLESLVLFRIAQGFAGGPIMPLSQAILQQIFPKEKQGAAIGLWAATTMAAPILGPILGGLISDNVSWHWIFFINLPVVAICLFVVFQRLRVFETPLQRQPIDIIGFVLLVIGVGAFQIMLDTGREQDWFASREIIGLAIVSAIAIAVFVIWELTDDHPIVDLKIFRHRGFAAATSVISIGFGSFFAVVVLTPLWLQSVFGYSATQAGYTVAWIGVFSVLVAPVAGLLLARVDPRITVTCGVIWLGVMAAWRTSWSTDSSYLDLVLPHLLTGLGMPFFFIGLTSLAMASVKPEESVSAAGIQNFCRVLCGAIGTAIATSQWDTDSRQVRAAMADGMNGVDAAMAKLQGAGLSMEQARASIDRLLEVQAATLANLHIYASTALLFFFAAALVWLIPKVKVTGAIGGGH
ncbi:DHA2 family efflux MFS transporter permease subunit [Sandarakinorhabdus limnophila]|uniref:DHA2 family efflux MFS transporter permease subunit n=1 Tax=Sandarakinorhabdus limnophila TaxID=210512 RepID=UPI0026E9CFA0|nr:DHA2 family efflux MFS transporter permease subunit [Sandarakinorhabdus limnophila]